MNEDNVAIRLKGFIDYLGVSSSQFADQCGIPRPSLSQLLNGRNKKISDVLVGQIHSAYPELNVVWLLFGEGSMLNSPSSGPPDEESSEEGCVSAEGSHDEPIGGLGGAGANNMKSVRSVSGENPLEKALADKDSTIEELRKEIERLKRNPRKVAQITVYYDDSTFETFYPASGAVRGR